MTVVQLKSHLLGHCQQQVDARYNKIKQTISSIEESLWEENKSSSGDKHETGRAVLQIDRENAGQQLLEIEKLTQILKRIDIRSTSEYARLGSLVYTDRFIYFISLSIGAVTIGETSYLCVALNSPVGLLLSGKRERDEFNLNGITQSILRVR